MRNNEIRRGFGRNLKPGSAAGQGRSLNYKDLEEQNSEVFVIFVVQVLCRKTEFPANPAMARIIHR